MKVSQINHNTYLPNNLYRNNNGKALGTNFKGLWGEDEIETYSDSTFDVETTRRYYYPFKDESKSDIEKVVEETSYDDVYTNSAASDPITHCNSLVVAVMSALPFTSKDFREYLNNCCSELKKLVIERHILEKNLRR